MIEKLMRVEKTCLLQFASDSAQCDLETTAVKKKIKLEVREEEVHG